MSSASCVADDDEKAAKLFDLGIECVTNSDFVGARASFERAIALSSVPDAVTHCNLGVARERLGDVEGAIESYRTASQLDDTDPFALVNLGDALVRRDRLRDAERAYLAALRIQGESHDEPWGTLNNLGVCYENMGDASRARKCYLKAVSLRPSYAMASENLRRLVKRTKTDPKKPPPIPKELVIQDVVESPSGSPTSSSTVSNNTDVDVNGEEEEGDEELEARFDCSLVSIPFFFLFCARISGDPDSPDKKQPSRTPPSDQPPPPPPQSDSQPLKHST